MANFSDNQDALDATIREHLCDDATYYPVSGEAPLPCRVIFEVPSQTETLQQARMVQAKPTIEVEVAVIPSLVKGDMFDVATLRWRVAAAPTRPGDGRWWLAELDRIAR